MSYGNDRVLLLLKKKIMNFCFQTPSCSSFYNMNAGRAAPTCYKEGIKTVVTVYWMILLLIKTDCLPGTTNPVVCKSLHCNTKNYKYLSQLLCALTHSHFSDIAALFSNACGIVLKYASHWTINLKIDTLFGWTLIDQKHGNLYLLQSVQWLIT